jgi:hypothetical protein
MAAHTCHARGCTTPVPPRMFMCRTHWYKVRKPLRDAIWAEYRPGQERDKMPSARYMAVQRRAVGEVAFKPHDEQAARDAAPYLIEAENWRRRAIEAGQGDPLEGIAPLVDMGAQI